MAMNRERLWWLCQVLWLLNASHAEINIFNVNVDQHESAVVCGVTHWAKHRVSAGRFLYNSFDPMLCTHLIYSYASYDADSGRIVAGDPTIDLSTDEGGRNGYAEYIGLKQKNKRLKVLVAIGGYNDGVSKYSELVGDVNKRTIFVNSVVEFIRKNKFDGLDFSWIFPGDLSRGGKLEDKKNFPLILQELNEAFKKEHNSWILSISIAPTKHFIEGGYDFKMITAQVDFINILAQAYHGPWDKETGFTAPLYQGSERDQENNIHYTLDMLMTLKVKPSKLVLGIPLQAITYTLDDSRINGLGAPASDPGIKGRLTDNEGTRIYKEVCQDLAKGGWRTVWDDEQKVPYAYKKDFWMSYEDERSVTEKVFFAFKNELKGVGLNYIDMDDATASCQTIKMPMLRTVNKILAEQHEASSVIDSNSSQQIHASHESLLAILLILWLVK